MSDTTDRAGAEADPEALMADYGKPDYTRRLADKIVFAFNHAAALNREDVAELLEQALAKCVQGEKDDRNAVALGKTARWREFIARRDAYKIAREQHDYGSAELTAALEHMKSAYAEWSEHP